MSSQARRGRFITLEGIDGAGKSTHLAFIRDWLARHAIDAVFTREPGGTPLGEKIRELLL
ncbi:dTMP kinase, partial [Chromobacterium piscinae]